MRENLGDILALIAVARSGSFTKAAAELRVSQPALSLTIKRLEERLGTSLLVRSTRSVKPTEAGNRLINQLSPEFSNIDLAIQSIKEFRDRPVGTIKITAIDYAIRTVIAPKLPKFLAQYPDVKVEIANEYASVDVVAKGYDAGVRFGEALAQDMISVRIGPDVKNAVVAAKSYLSKRVLPANPSDLLDHSCINLRTSTYGGLYEWEFAKGKRSLNMRVEGALICNNAYDILDAVRAGLGFAYLPSDLVAPFIAKGHLVSVLEDWCPTWSGFHLYYPNRRQQSRAMTLLVDALRYRP